MIKETKTVIRTEQDKKIRQNQISELIKIFEEDQIQADIAQSFSNQLEQAAFDLSGGENTREYRTRLNTVKIRLNGTKGQFIRLVLLQSIMTPLELMAFDMSKLNENAIQTFLEQNNRQLPQKNVSNRLAQRKQGDIDFTQNSNEKQKEFNDDQKVNLQQQQKEQVVEEKLKQEKPNTLTEFSVPQVKSEVKQKQDELPKQPISTNTETEKIDFAPQEEPIQQFEEYIDYSFEYNQKQRDFVEGNDFPNIEELQINEIKKNNQLDDQYGNSPLPSDNVLNQEFLQDDPQDIVKENAQTKILDSQIQEEEQKYYDHECSFQAQEQQLIDFKKQNYIQEQQSDHQLAEFAISTNTLNQNIQQPQQNNIEEMNNIHTYHFEQQIHQKVLEQHQQEQKNVKDTSQQQQDAFEELPGNYEEFFNFIAKRDQQFEKQILQLLEQNKTLTEQFYNIQLENQEQQENLEIQNLNCQNLIQQLINENKLLKLSYQQNEQQQQSLVSHLKEQSLIEKAQFQKVYQSQLSNQQKHKEFLEQIRFNLDYRKDTVLKLTQQNQQTSNLDDEINQIQDILIKQNIIENNYSMNTQTNENQLFNQQYWATENDTQTIGTVVNADSGSTQIRRNQEALNTEIQDEIEQNQIQNEAQSIRVINQARTFQQGIDNLHQNQNIHQEQIRQDDEQQLENQFNNKRNHNKNQIVQDGQGQGQKNNDNQLQQDQQQQKQMRNNHQNKEVEANKNEQRKRQQVKRSNIPESLFD